MQYTKDEYIKYIKSNIDSISDYINKRLRNSRLMIKSNVIYGIKKCLNPWPEKYNVVDNQLVKCGLLDADMQLYDFLQQYDGLYDVEYKNSMTITYSIYEDSALLFSISFISKIVKNGVKYRLETAFNVDFDTDIGEKVFIVVFCECSSDIYERLIIDINDSKSILQFCGIQDMKLSDIV